ncbi:hypothetical protein LTR04_005703 [Oleoguttula sp. CCFEE 6159]|nr:hypothetical protein LTR04_005703 [Oleoguttula sp. CCFEE 6159]
MWSATLTAEDTWENVFLNLYRADQHVERFTFLVADGLDEAPESARSTILNLFTERADGTFDARKTRIQVAALGRKPLRGEMDFNIEQKAIEVTPQKNHDDIDNYIHKRSTEVQVLKKLQKIKPKEAKKTARRYR